MNKFTALFAIAALAAAPTFAAAQSVATVGKAMYTADGKRIGAVYRVAADGSASVIINGKLITIPASTITLADGKLMTNLGKAQLVASR